LTDAATKPLISLVVPVYNEELNVGPFHAEVSKVIATLTSEYDFEFVFTDNHSTDETFARLKLLAATDSRIRVYRFSRNFGYQRSIMTGYAQARGAAAIQLDCDLQDPPALIETFLSHWQAGADVVYGVRMKRQEGWSINMARRVFYRLIDKLSEDKIPVDAGDFRLVSRRVIEVLRGMEDSQPYLRGMIASLGFEQVGIPLDGILNHSTVPLRLSTYFGFATSVLTLLGIVGYVLVKLLLHSSWPAGFATLAALILASISINAMLLGIIGEYLGRMYRQGKKIPLTIIEAVIDPSIS